MRHLGFQLCLVAVLGAAFSACAPKPPVEVLREHPQRDLLGRLQARADFWEGYQAKVVVRAESAKKTFSIQAVIVARLPGQLRFEASKLGQTAGVLVFDRSKSSLWIPSERVNYTAATGESLVEHFLGAAIPPEAFSRSLIAALSRDQLANLQVLPDQAGLLIHSREPGSALAFTWRLTPDLQAIESAFVREEEGSYSIHYDPPVSLDPQAVPAKVRLVSPQWQLEVKIDRMVPAKDPPASAFQVPLPEGTRTVDIAPI